MEKWDKHGEMGHLSMEKWDTHSLLFFWWVPRFSLGVPSWVFPILTLIGCPILGCFHWVSHSWVFPILGSSILGC